MPVAANVVTAANNNNNNNNNGLRMRFERGQTLRQKIKKCGVVAVHYSSGVGPTSLSLRPERNSATEYSTSSSTPGTSPRQSISKRREMYYTYMIYGVVRNKLPLLLYRSPAQGECSLLLCGAVPATG